MFDIDLIKNFYSNYKNKVDSAFGDYQKVGWDIMKKRYLVLINRLLN